MYRNHAACLLADQRPAMVTSGREAYKNGVAHNESAPLDMYRISGKFNDLVDAFTWGYGWEFERRLQASKDDA